MRVIDETGNQYGRLMVIERSGSKRGAAFWLCRCECGRHTTVIGTLLRSGVSRSCGCLSVEHLVSMNLTHGHARQGALSPTFLSWAAMRDRCSRSTNKDYARYGGRGISVCDRWRDSFTAFLEDMGERPSDQTLDRINPDGDYEPGNCRWADAITQRHNRSTQ